MRADDDRVLVVRSMAAEAVTRGRTRVRAELAHVKGLVAALAEAAADAVALPTTGGSITGKLQLPLKPYALQCSSIQGTARPRRPV